MSKYPLCLLHCHQSQLSFRASLFAAAAAQINDIFSPTHKDKNNNKVFKVQDCHQPCDYSGPFSHVLQKVIIGK